MASINRPFSGKGPNDGTRDIPHDYRRVVGARLRKHREEQHMTQTQLGTRLGLAIQTISHWENGRTPVPVERYEEISEAFGQDKAEFGRFLLRFTNPWLFALIYGVKNGELRSDLAQFGTKHRA